MRILSNISSDLVVAKSDPWEVLDMAASSNAAWVIRRAGVYRWLWQTQDAETGGNTGSNLVLKPRDDSGANIAAGFALTINRATGLVSVIANPTAALGVATKQYVDTRIAVQTAQPTDGAEIWIDTDEPDPTAVLEERVAQLEARIVALEAMLT